MSRLWNINRKSKSCRAEWLIVAAGLAWLCAVHPVVGAESSNTLDSAVSVSRQFITYAHGTLLAQAVGVFAEQVRREWADLLDVDPTWRDPIFIVLDPQATPVNTPPVQVGVARSELRLRYRILYRTTPLDQRTLANAIVEALCAELSNRARPVMSTGPFSVAPSAPWLVQGVAQSILGRDEFLTQIARQSLAGGQPQTASALIGTKQLPTDPAEGRLFRANAWLFAEGLLRLPHGADKMRRYLTELSLQESITKAFWMTYGEDFQDTAALERWWAVELSNRLAASIARNLTVPETSQRLTDILNTRVTSSDVSTGAATIVAFRDLWRFDEQGWLNVVLREKLLALADLRARAAPVYRPVLDGYGTAIRLLADEKINPFRRTVAETDKARARVEQEARQVSDYLDEAERIFAPRELNSAYSNFFRVFEEFETLEQQRRNPISDYLDKFDK